ncbi:hypothetical protein [Verrucomicrobium sp. BvORR034]|jgi:hypothetical protein|uniref:hypothetical protein n=1 Tax=Verrucomicrobium sp. BvORR034 TaxID=1396418 RepID=UPI002240EF2B|nr:hypothetical protein [Verrucomicrobium sp. BvORR034]
MKTKDARNSASAARRPMAPLAIWIFEALAIIVLTLVMTVINEFRHHPAATPVANET